MTAVDSPELVDSEYAAKWLRVNVATINRKCRQGKVPGAFKFGHRWLIRKDQLEQMFDPSRVTGESTRPTPSVGVAAPPRSLPGDGEPGGQQ